MTSDPVRLLEDPSAGSVLRSDLVHAARAEVHGLDLAAGLVALQKATATVTSSTTTVVASTSLLTKLGIGTGVAVGALVLWLGLGTGPEPGAGERVTPPAVASAPELEHEDPRGGLGGRFEGTAAPVRSEVPPSSAKPEPAQPEPVQPNDDALDSAAAGEAEATAPGSELSPDAEGGAPKPASTSRRRGATGARSSGDTAPEATRAPTDDVLREAKLVAKARGQLARDPARALALAEDAERDFPKGQLVEERRAIAIRALVALGRLDEAQRRAEPFLAEYGRGAHAAAVRRALEPDTDAP
jgi:hypothetical protein